MPTDEELAQAGLEFVAEFERQYGSVPDMTLKWTEAESRWAKAKMDEHLEHLEHQHQWIDITSLESLDDQYICRICNAYKIEPRGGWPLYPQVWGPRLTP